MVLIPMDSTTITMGLAVGKSFPLLALVATLLGGCGDSQPVAEVPASGSLTEFCAAADKYDNLMAVTRETKTTSSRFGPAMVATRDALDDLASAAPAEIEYHASQLARTYGVVVNVVDAETSGRLGRNKVLSARDLIRTTRHDAARTAEFIQENC